MKRIVIEVADDKDVGDIKEFLYHGAQPKQVVWKQEPYEMQETWTTADGKQRMTTKQRDALWELCGRYNVPFRETDYRLIASGASLMGGYVEGWVGGREHNGDWGETKATVYVGVSPDGRVNT